MAQICEYCGATTIKGYVASAGKLVPCCQPMAMKLSIAIERIKARRLQALPSPPDAPQAGGR